MEINRELSKRQFMQKENDYHHSPYETELEFYSAVRAGDLETVKRLYTPLDTNGKGRLSKDDLRNIKYHLVITIAMLCRFCIEGGLDPETAYTISDIYINKCDECRNEESVMAVHKEVIEMVISYAKSISFGVRHLEFSPIKGPEGNIEYLVHLVRLPDGVTEEETNVDVDAIVKSAHNTLDK